MVHGASLFVLKITGHRSLELLNLERLPQPDAKADSEIFNKFGRNIESGRCTMRNHDFVSDGFLALIVAGLLLLCSGLLVIAFS